MGGVGGRIDVEGGYYMYIQDDAANVAAIRPFSFAEFTPFLSGPDFCVDYERISSFLRR